MNRLSLWSKAYIFGTLAVGSVLSVWQLAYLQPLHWGLLVAVCVLAAVLQILKVEGATARSSYNLSWIVYGAALAVFSPPEALLVILVAHLAEWAWHRYLWFIQSFNIATFVITISLAEFCRLLVGSIPYRVFGLRDAAALLLSLAVFTVVNHLMIGMVIKLARGQSLAQSGVFTFTTLMIDFGLLCVGISAALIGSVNPFAIVFIIIVAYLLHTVLRMPALERKSELDAKTGLYNTQYFDSALQKELPRAQKSGRPLSLVMADLDRLRDLNNTYGHLAGDAVLKKVAQILQASARDSDVVSRFGGEEFSILLPNTTPAEAAIQVEAMRKAIEAAEFTVSTHAAPVKATMSFGVAGHNGDGQTAKQLVHNADLAVYRAKHTGRNRVCVYEESEGEMESEIVSPFEKKVAASALNVNVNGDTKLTATPVASPTPAPTPELPSMEAKHAGSSSPIGVNANRFTNLFVGGTAMAAVGLLALLQPFDLVSDWRGLLVFTFLALLLEIVAINIYERDSSVSTSVAALLACTLAFGGIGTLVSSLVVSLVAQLKHRKPLNRFVFNISNHLIGGLLCVALIGLSGKSYQEWSLPIQLLISLLGAGVIYGSSTVLLAGVISVTTHQPIRQLWLDRFRWLGPHFLALGFVAYALLFSYHAAGLSGILVLLAPLSMLHISQRQYIEATKSMVNKLRNTNVELAQQTQKVHKLNDELLLALASTIDLRDPFVVEHSRHVARYAELTATELGLSPEHVELVYQAGLMHDIGKLAIPEAILFKSDRLTAEEYETVKEHVTIGAELLGTFQSLHRISTFVRHHHERYDGRGYPDALAGEEIPLEARILALADAVEAMASDRPYRAGSPTDMILSEVAAHAGSQFDPVVVRAFESIVRAQGDSFIVNSARHVGLYEENGTTSMSSDLWSSPAPEQTHSQEPPMQSLIPA